MVARGGPGTRHYLPLAGRSQVGLLHNQERVQLYNQDDTAAAGTVANKLVSGTSPRSRMMAAAMQAAHEEAAARRERVLAHPDLRLKLTEAPIGYERPDQWNGYVPPKTDAEQSCPDCRNGIKHCRNTHMASANTSARRRALIEIAAEALRRENTRAQEDAA